MSFQPQRQQTLLAQGKESGVLSLKLVTLVSDLTINFSSEDLNWNPPGREQIMNFLEKHNFQSLIKRASKLYDTRSLYEEAQNGFNGNTKSINEDVPTTTCITYMGWNSNYLNGPIGWMRLETYGPKCCENVVQGVARDILAHGMTQLAGAGYPIVLHVHDEIVAEVPHGWGSVEEFERLMSTMPAWAAGWPVRAAGGWRGQRYRKG